MNKSISEHFQFEEGCHSCWWELVYCLFRDLDCINKNGSLSIGSHIWLAQGKTLNPKFKETIKDISNVEVDKLDFSSSDSVDEVNDWVNKLTK